jgi:CheY-like chemotaxis protein
MQDYMLIDDDSVINFLHKELISIVNPLANVREFQSSKQALLWFADQANQQSVNDAIVFLDINMPEMNGFEFLDSLNNLDLSVLEGKCKIVMVTSSLNDKDKELALSYKLVSNYMEKPLTMEYLSSLS